MTFQAGLFLYAVQRWRGSRWFIFLEVDIPSLTCS